MTDTMITRESNLDLTKVAALQQKRTLAFVNHFVVTTVQFLNGFMKRCEQKLMNFERKLEKVEAAMVLLESRLSSIPEVNTPQPDTTSETAAEPAETPAPQLEQQSSTDNPEESVNNTENTKENVQILPEYNRFVKMVQVGVPLEAVKLKVSLEGLDPGVFERIVAK